MNHLTRTAASRLAAFIAVLALGAGLAGCGSRDDTAAPAAATTTTAAPSAPEPPVGRFITRLFAEDGRADLAGTWGFNIEPDGTWSICPFCTTVPGPFGGTYTIDGDRITLGPDPTCTTSVTYEWSAAAGTLTLSPVGDDPCGLVPGNRQFVLTAHPFSLKA